MHLDGIFLFILYYQTSGPDDQRVHILSPLSKKVKLPNEGSAVQRTRWTMAGLVVRWMLMEINSTDQEQAFHSLILFETVQWLGLADVSFSVKKKKKAGRIKGWSLPRGRLLKMFNLWRPGKPKALIFDENQCYTSHLWFSSENVLVLLPIRHKLIYTESIKSRQSYFTRQT